MGKVLLVTGGSRGIGAAIARLAGAQGYDVAVNYRSERDAAEAVAAAIRQSGRRAGTIPGDDGGEAEIERLFETVDREFGQLTHFVNNAGITGRASRVDE